MAKYNEIYLEYRRKLKEEVVYISNGDVDPDSEYDEEDLFDQVDQLEKDSPINILRGKELIAVYMDTGKVVAALYTEVSGDEFSFDVIVGEDHQGRVIGSKMLDIAIEVFEQQKDGNDEMIIRLDVVNPVMKKALEKRGFDVKDKVGKDRWIMGIMDDDPEDEEVKDAEAEHPEEDEPVEESIEF